MGAFRLEILIRPITSFPVRRSTADEQSSPEHYSSDYVGQASFAHFGMCRGADRLGS